MFTMKSYIEFLNQNIVFKRFFDEHHSCDDFVDLLCEIGNDEKRVIAIEVGLDEFSLEQYEFVITTADIVDKDDCINADLILLCAAIELQKLGLRKQGDLIESLIKDDFFKRCVFSIRLMQKLNATTASFSD